MEFFTINSFSLIPVTRFIISNFARDRKVTVAECVIKNVGIELKGLEKRSLAVFNSYREFARQTSWQRLKKYIILWRSVWSAYRRKSTVYVLDHQVLIIFLFLNKLSKRNLTVYHQFEMVDDDVLTRFNVFVWNYILKNARLIDLSIFPEKNRAEHFISLSGVPESKTMIFANTCEKGETSVSTTSEILSKIPKDKIVCAHIGNVGPKHFLDFFLDLVEASAGKNVFFLMIGRYSSLVAEKLKSVKNPDFCLADAIPHAELLKLYPRIDYGFILYKGVSPNFEYCAPNKLYEYLAHGVKVFAHPLTGLRDLHMPSQLLELVDMENPDTIKQLDLTKANTKHEEIVDYFTQQLSIEKELEKLTQKINLLETENA